MRRALSAVPTERADALPERSGRDIDERQPRRRVSLEIRPDRPQLQQLFARKQPGFGPRRVQNRRGVPLRQHEPIVVDVLRVLRIEPHLAEEERGDDLGRRQAARRMSGSRFGRGPHRIDAELSGDVLQSGKRCRHLRFHFGIRLGQHQELESLSPRTGGAHGEHVVRRERALAGGQRRHRGDDAVGDPREFLIARAQREPPQRARGVTVQRKRLQWAGASGRSPARPRPSPARGRESRRRARPT